MTKRCDKIKYITTDNVKCSAVMDNECPKSRNKKHVAQACWQIRVKENIAAVKEIKHEG